jgi:hypothetical protein
LRKISVHQEPGGKEPTEKVSLICRKSQTAEMHMHEYPQEGKGGDWSTELHKSPISGQYDQKIWVSDEFLHGGALLPQANDHALHDISPTQLRVLERRKISLYLFLYLWSDEYESIPSCI